MDHDIEHEADAAGPVAAPGFLEACIMLALDAKPTYGYELKGELDDLGFHVDRGRIYRALRAMEAAGLVRSRWDTTSRGPAPGDLRPRASRAGGAAGAGAGCPPAAAAAQPLPRRYERAAAARSKAVA